MSILCAIGMHRWELILRERPRPVGRGVCVAFPSELELAAAAGWMIRFHWVASRCTRCGKRRPA